MKRVKRLLTGSTLVLCLLAGINIFFDSICIAVPESIKLEPVYPHVFTSGNGDDLLKECVYPVEAAEKQKNKIVIPIVVTNAGLLSYDIRNYTEVVSGTCISGAGITTVIYEDENCEKKVTKKIKGSFGKKGLSIAGGKVQVKKNRTYYVLLSVSEEVKSKNGKFSFEIGLQQTTGKNRTLKEKQWAKAYQKGKGSSIYYKVNMKNTGCMYVDISYDKKQHGNPGVVLCDDKKKVISQKTECTSKTDDRIVYALNKGVYYIKVSDLEGEYQLRYSCNSLKEKSGATKNKAKKIEVGGKASKGLILLQESDKKYDWYKFVLKKPSKVHLVFSGSTTGNSRICFEVIPPERDKEGKEIEFRERPLIYLKGIEEELNAKSDIWPAGTWYIRVKKENGSGSGEYGIEINLLS